MMSDEIIKAINDEIQESMERDDCHGLWEKYVKFGDLTEVSYIPNELTLMLTFEGKAYGDSRTSRGEIKIMNATEFSIATPRFHKNWKGDWDITVNRDVVGNRIYRKAKEMGLVVSRVAFVEYDD